MKRRIIFLCACFLSICICSKPFCRIEDYSIKDGLAQSVVTGLLQDKKGYMWFSTWNGLNKYDGYTFKKYKSVQGDGSTFISNRINAIVESQYADIWCLSYDERAYLFDSRTEKFIDILQPIEFKIHQTNLVKKIYSLPKGVAWITCEGGNSFRVDELLGKSGEGITFYGTFNNTLKGEEIYQVYQDAEGDEWVLTDKGITIIGVKSIDSDFPFNHILEHEGTIWLASSNGKLAQYDKQTSTPKFVEIPFRINQIHEFKDLGDDILAIGSNNGLILYDAETKTFEQINVITPTQKVNDVTHVSKVSNGEIWLFTSGKGVTRVNRERNKVEHYFTPEEDVVQYERAGSYFIHEDPLGYIWMSIKEGNFHYYDRKKNKLASYLSNPKDPDSAFFPHIRFYSVDKQDNFWFTSNRGLEKITFYKEKYKQTIVDNGMEVRAFLNDSGGRFWVASKSGKIRIHNKEGKFEGYLSVDGRITQGNNAFRNSAYCIMEDDEKNIWVGTRHNGLFVLKPRDGNDFSYTINRYVNDPLDSYSINSNSIYSIYQDHRGRIWVGCYLGGLNLVSKDENGEINFIHNGNLLRNYPSSNSSKIRYITEVDHVIMVGTTDGLLTFSTEFTQPEEIKFYRNVRRPQSTTSINHNDITHIYKDSRGDIYVMAFTGGVNKVISDNLLSDNIVFKAYTERNGLESDLALSMIEDKNGYLWIISENTLTKFDPVKEEFDDYGEYFAKQSFVFSEAIPAINSASRLVLGTDVGTVEIDPEQMSKSNYIPPIVFTDVKIQGVTAYTDIDNLDMIKLNPSERNMTLQFATLDYIDARQIRYAYRLKGLETDWNYTDKIRTASYLNLPHGEYKFQVKSTNSDGVWVDNIKTLSVVVMPTFWETIWAWILYALLFILLTGTVVYVLFYIYRLRHRVDLEQQLSNIKLRFFTDISHELRTPLTLISSPVAEVLEHEPLTPTARDHLTLVQKNTNRMLQLVNQILDFRKIQNKKMKVLVEETDVILLLSKIVDNFCLIAEEKQIDFKVESDYEKLMVWVDKDKFEKIYYNLLSNAFKFTPVGKGISVKITMDRDCVFISVVDEGIGIQPQKMDSLFQRFETLATRNILKSSSGIGLSLVKELVELHHGVIDVFSEPGKGSEFRVKFLMGNEHFRNDSQAEFILSDISIQSEQIDPESYMPQTGHPYTVPEYQETEDEKLSILIVEDNDELRRFLSNILNRNYNVLEAVNGSDGLNMILEHIPDIIISDVAMPEMDGLEMVKAMKENTDVCHIPVILLSSKSSLDDRIKGLEQGIDDYITKPFSATYLKTRIAALLRQRKQLQESYMNALADKRGFSSPDAFLSQPQIVASDEKFLKDAVEFIEQHIDKADLTIDDFANALLMSRTVFYRKLKSIVGLTPVDFVREVRVKKALLLIDTGQYTFSQVAYMTGFNDPKYFTKCFKKQFGMTPSEYKESKMIQN